MSEAIRTRGGRDQKFLEELFKGIERSTFYRVNSKGEMEAVKLNTKTP